ncbi:leucine-rich repeat-containing protein 42 isoform X2 [Salminus brasiliensis]|uniref:leucine-rich repeat-containing protein 42 isoform X2 n=1 Tax=Salminus brasiliensis TaxID=930266 RepID=UPI003B83080F
MSSGCGSVYVREKGQLHRVDADGVQSSSFKHRLFQKDFTVQLCVESLPPISRQSSDHFIFTYNTEGSLCYTVKSLLDISLLFIADHVEHVDSLVGFPEQMAHRLFVSAEEKQKFSDPSTSARALQVFSEAYGELVLRSLCLRDRLVRLFLGVNCLSDKGLQRLTAPIRVMKKGLENLQQLDVSGNPLTEKGLGYLACLKSLQELDVSGTSVKSDASLRSFFRSKMGMVLSAEPLEIFSHSECKTAGWAEEVINQWERKASEVQKKDAKPRTNALQFYGREKFVRETIHATCDDQKSQEVQTRIHFHKPDPHCTSQQAGHSKDPHSQTALTTQVGRKRRLSNERDKDMSPPAKRQPVNSFTADDLDLLNSY